MPLRLLRASRQRLQLRKQLGDRRRAPSPARSRSTAAARRAAFRSRPRRARRGRSSSGIGAAQAAASRRRARARAARRTAPRAARAGCRRRKSPDRRRAGGRAPISPRPSNGSKYSPVSGSQAMALTVKSRRRAASSIDIAGVAGDVEPAMAAAGFRFAAGQRDVDAARLVDLKALADRFDAAERFEQRAQPLGGDAEDFEVECLSTRGPCSRSRTQPPTISARPPAARTAAASASARSSRSPVTIRYWAVTRRRPNRLTNRSQYPGAIAFSSTSAARFLVGVDLRGGAGDRRRDRVGDRLGGLPRAVGA